MVVLYAALTFPQDDFPQKNRIAHVKLSGSKEVIKAHVSRIGGMHFSNMGCPRAKMQTARFLIAKENCSFTRFMFRRGSFLI